MKLLAALVFSAGLLFVGCAKPDGQLANGEAVHFPQWQDQWLVVNYWAVWCGPCRAEIPELNVLHAQAGVRVLGVNFDALKNNALTESIAEMGIEFPVIVQDPGVRWQFEPPTVLPSTLLIAPGGELHSVLQGPQTLESLNRAMGLTTAI